MISIDKAVVAKYKKDGKEFEVLVDCDKALEFKQGKTMDINDIVASDKIYRDSKKGFVAPSEDIKKVFGSDDFYFVTKEIIRKGEVQLTKEYRNKLKEQIKKKIVDIIHRNAVDSKTKLPHPPQRIENALEEAKIHIDELKSAEEQVQNVLDKLKTIIPIKFVRKEILIKVPSKYSGKAYGVVKKYGEILRENWEKDGSLVILSKVPGGVTEEYFTELNNLTHGEIESKIINEDG